MIPKPTVESQKSVERRQVNTALPAPQVESRPGKSQINSPGNTSTKLDVGDIIVLEGKEKFYATEYGVCMVINVHLTSPIEETGRDEGHLTARLLELEGS